MQLTREKGQRMWGGGGSSIAGGGGGGGTSLAGYATESWVDDNYLSKEFWNQLFVIHTSTTTTVKDSGGTIISGPTTVNTTTLDPNTLAGTTETTDEATGNVTTVTVAITSIEAKKGLWTDFFLSALGKNASGTGGVLSLKDLVDVDPNLNPTNGQSLVYNGTSHLWEAQTIGGGGGGGTLTSIGLVMPTGFSVNPATLTSNGSFTVSFATGYTLPTSADVQKGVTAYGWGDHAQAGYATQTWVEQNYLSIAFFARLFQAYNGTTAVNPNDNTTTIDNIKAMFGFWTDQYLSALGQNSSGGGGSGSSTLAGLNDVQLGTLNANDVLTYDGNGHWVNTPKSTFLSGYATQAWVGQQNYLTTETDPTVPAWAKASTKPSYSFSELTSHPTTLSDYGITDAYTKNEADATFMTIAAFENLFNAMNSSGQKVNHPYSSAVASIKAMVGLYTDQFLSALGLNSSGGGGGVSLNEPLLSINNAGLSNHPSSSGQTIIWNGSAWAYGTTGSGTVTSVSMTVPTGMSVSPSTITSSGTFAISFATGYGIPLTADVTKGVTAYGWGDHSQVGYWKDGTGNHPTTLSGYGITDALPSSALSVAVSGSTLTITLSGITYSLTDTNTWRPVEDNLTSDSADNSLSAKQGKLLKGYIDTLNSYFDSNGNAKTALKLATARTLWGQSFDGSANVSGNMTDVLSIYMSGGIIGPESIELNTNGGLQNYGGFIDFHYNGSLADYTSRIIEEAGGVLSISAGERVLNETTGEYEFNGKAASVVVGSGYNNSSIVIGNGKLVWDETNNSLKVIRSNGSAANIYATGGVSALGMQAGVSALDAMTFNYVTINNNLEFGAASRITHAVINDDRTLYIGNSDNSGWVGLADMCSQAGSDKWYIYAATGEASFMTSVRSARFYLDSSRYLYLDGSNNLMFFNGSTAKQVAFTN